MSSSQRSRTARGGGTARSAQQSGEEVELWEKVQVALAELSRNEARAKVLGRETVEMEAAMKADDLAGKKLSIERLDALGDLYRENVKLAERSKSILTDDDIMTRVSILQTVVKDTEDQFEAASMRASNSRDSRMDLDGPSDSPVPSPAENKHVRKHAGQPRTSSQPPRDKDSVKDEKEEKDSGNPSRTKIVFALGAEVAFKPKVQGQTEEHDWIQGIVVKVIGEGKSRRYDVQDPFPDDNTRPGETYRSSASSMVTIPPVGTPLQDYEVGKRVLALYPETTTFYRAEVKAMLDGGAKVQLLFEDEAMGAQKVVERRFVLDHKG